MSSIAVVYKELNSTETQHKFVKSLSAIAGIDAEKSAERFALEVDFFVKELHEKNLGVCSPISIKAVFLEVIRNGLSFLPSSRQVYLTKRNVSTGNGREDRLYWDTTNDGKIYLCQVANSIKHATAPIIVYEGDVVKRVSNMQGEQVVYHESAIPRKSNKIIGGFCYVVMPDGKREPFWMGIEDMDRLKAYSEKNNRGPANPLYSSNGGQPDTGFMASKILKFALKNFRKRELIGSLHQQENEDAEYSEYNDGPHAHNFIDETRKPAIENAEHDDEPF